MRVKGTELAHSILQNLKKEIETNNLYPGLAIMYASQNYNSKIYIDKKIKAAKEIGIVASLYTFEENQQQHCIDKIDQLNLDRSIHGMIVQLPVFRSWEYKSIESHISNEKDVDGFKENSPYFGATALGVWSMLTEFARIENTSIDQLMENKKLVVVGKGKTAGGLIIKLLTQKGYQVAVIDSKTPNPVDILKEADIIISASGQKHIITPERIKEGAYVIGVGVGSETIDNQTKVFGDVSPDVESKAKLYCPTVGGIGPLTVAFLLKNVVEAAQKKLSSF